MDSREAPKSSGLGTWGYQVGMGTLAAKKGCRHVGCGRRAETDCNRRLTSGAEVRPSSERVWDHLDHERHCP
jgi:hypothetical protein